MTATPHNGKEEDFQLFLALLDGDRFEGRFRDGVHAVDVSDLMRRMVKEEPASSLTAPALFPERLAYTVLYQLSDAEARLYKAGYRLCKAGIQPCRSVAERQAGRHGRFCPDHVAAAPGVFSGSHLPVPAPAPRAPARNACVNWKLLQRGAAAATIMQPSDVLVSRC
jgi:hypothetical protein